MNIIKARDQLNELTKNNPEHLSFNTIQTKQYHYELSIPHKLRTHRNQTKLYHYEISIPHKLRTHRNFLKQPHLNQFSQHLSKNQRADCRDAINRMSQKGQSQQKIQSQQKVEVKTPIFKNSKLLNFQQQQKSRYQKLGLQNFLKQMVINKKIQKKEQPGENKITKQQQPFEQKIIKNLNNTYFRTTQNIDAKRKNMVSTLGIKRSSMSNYQVEWNEKDVQGLELQWNEITYIPNKVFPCRKNQSLKSKIYTPKRAEVSKQTQISHRVQIGLKQKKKRQNSSKNLQNGPTLLQQQAEFKKTFANTLLKNKLSRPNTGRSYVNSKNLANVSKQLIKAQQFGKKQQIYKYFSQNFQQMNRPFGPDKGRPSTSKDAAKRNRKTSEQIISSFSTDKSYTEAVNRSYLFFTGSTSNLKTSNVSQKTFQNENNSDFLVGKKMSIHK